MHSILETADKLTLDEAEDRFDAKATPARAAVLALVAAQYVSDEMIGEDSFLAIMRKVAPTI